MTEKPSQTVKPYSRVDDEAGQALPNFRPTLVCFQV